MPDHLLNEMIQIDSSHQGSYGPVYDCDGRLIDFCDDGMACRDVVIENNIFKCDGFPGIGHHGDGAHHDIDIRGNIFDGPSGRYGQSRGYIFFMPDVYDVRVSGNAFFAPEDPAEPNVTMLCENPDPSALTESGNTFVGRFTDR